MVSLDINDPNDRDIVLGVIQTHLEQGLKAFSSILGIEGRNGLEYRILEAIEDKVLVALQATKEARGK